MQTGRGDSGLLPSEQHAVRGILAIFTEEAVAHAARYAEDAGRSAVLPEDLILALKFVAVPSYGFMGRPDVQRRIMAELLSDAESGDEESSEEDEEVPQEWTAAVSDNADDACNRMNAASEEFSAWQPTTVEGSVIKEAIIRAENMFVETGYP